jgi:hypothetical protein
VGVCLHRVLLPQLCLPDHHSQVCCSYQHLTVSFSLTSSKSFPSDPDPTRSRCAGIVLLKEKIFNIFKEIKILS